MTVTKLQELVRQLKGTGFALGACILPTTAPQRNTNKCTVKNEPDFNTKHIAGRVGDDDYVIAVQDRLASVAVAGTRKPLCWI